MDHSASRHHAAVTVRVGQRSAEIDTAIAPLIREIWKVGIDTFMSCQEDGWGKVWICFPDLVDLVRFLNIVARYEPGTETIYNRMNPQLLCSDSKPAWDYELHPNDSALLLSESGDEQEAAAYDGPADFFFTLSLRFPPCDLPTVLSRLRQHNRRNGR